mgnify:CR=1 FL=1
MNIPRGTTLTLESVQTLNESMESLSNQPKTVYTIRELITEGYEGIEKALKRHSYKVVAEKISEDLKITLSEGTLKKYVSDARKNQEEDSKPTTPATKKQKRKEKIETNAGTSEEQQPNDLINNLEKPSKVK